MRALVYLKRLFYVLVLIAVLVVTVGPWGLYWLGLYGVNGKPELPTSIATEDEKNEIWLKVRGKGKVEVTSTAPHNYIYQIYTHQTYNPGLRVAWQVASSHLLTNRRYKGGGWWHLSGAALTIWLTRNWTSEQIISRAVEIERVKNG